MLLANNEYGLHRNDKIYKDFNRYTKSLVLIDYLQDLFIGGYDMAAFWGNVGDEKFLMDKNFSYRLNPMAMGMELLAEAQGAVMLDCSIITKSPISGFAAKKEQEIYIFLLNKSNRAAKIELHFSGIDQARTLKTHTVSLIDTQDHWGMVTSNASLVAAHPINVQLPPLAFTRITVVPSVK